MLGLLAKILEWIASSNPRLEAAPLCPKKGRVSRTCRLRTTVRNCTRDEGGPFEAGRQSGAGLKPPRAVYSRGFPAMVIPQGHNKEPSADSHSLPPSPARDPLRVSDKLSHIETKRLTRLSDAQDLTGPLAQSETMTGQQ